MEKRDFDGALTHWLGMQGQVDGFTYWYNLGSLQIQRENFAEARFAFEKARHLTLYSAATEQQLHTAVDKLQVDTPAQSLSLGPLFTQALMYLGPMKIIFISLFVGVGVFLTMRKAWNAKKKIIVLVTAVVPLFLALWFKWTTVAFVALKPIEIFEGPSRVFAGGRSLPAGAKLLGWKDDVWVKVHDEAGNTLWLSKSEVVLKAGWLWGN